MTNTRMQSWISSVLLSPNIGPIFEGRKQEKLFSDQELQIYFVRHDVTDSYQYLD